MYIEAPESRLASRDGGKLQATVSATTGLLLALYRSVCEGPLALVLPEHTRDACFQLLCDVRANTPKDRRFLLRHARALAPHTAPGWLALCSALGFGFCGLVALACSAAVLAVAGVWTLTGLAVATGLFLAGLLGALSVCLLGAVLVSGAVASGALAMYVCASATLACLRVAARVVLGAPRASATCSAGGEAQAPLLSQQRGKEEDRAPALPPIRTKSPTRGQAAGRSPLGPASPLIPAGPPPASPRRLNLGPPATASAEPATPGGSAASAALPPSPLPATGTGSGGAAAGAGALSANGSGSSGGMAAADSAADSAKGSASGGSGVDTPPVPEGAAARTLLAAPAGVHEPACA